MLTRIKPLAAIVAFTGAITAFAGAAQGPQPELTPREQAAVQVALDRGELLYAYDQAAWHATDDFAARLRAAGRYDAVMPSTGGWIVEGPARAPVVTFFDKTRPRPRALYTATMSSRGAAVASGILYEAASAIFVSDPQLTLISDLSRARAAFVASKPQRCSPQPFNTALLPPQRAGEPTSVYFLTPQTTATVFPAGGHYRVDLRTNAEPAIRAFTRSCLDLAPQAAAVGRKAEALVVSHLLDPTPTEIHAFTMLAARLPLFVAMPASGRLWALEESAGKLRARLVARQKP